VPEPRGRSFAELDLLFAQGVSARKFASTRVDVFDETVEGSTINEYERRMSAVGTGEKVGYERAEVEEVGGTSVQRQNRKD
jgi:hypothetical protein